MPDQTSKALEGLFVDESEPAIDSLLRSSLEPVAGFTRDGKLVTKSPFLKLPDTAKIIAVLLARQAMSRLNLPSARPESSPEQLANDCAVPLKSCREHLSRMKAKRLLEKNDTGYFVPIWAIAEAARALQGKG